MRLVEFHLSNRGVHPVAQYGQTDMQERRQHVVVRPMDIYIGSNQAGGNVGIIWLQSKLARVC